MEALVRRLMPGLALLATSALAVAGCGSSSAGGSGSGGSGTMNIGVIYPFTGANADQGAIGMAGCLTGVAAVNAAGGVQGRKFVCKSFDTKGDPADATSAANQMMASANPVMVIGASDDAVTTAPKMTALGHKLVADVTLAPGQSSYRTEIAKIIAAKPDALVTEMDPQSAATFLSEYQQLAGHLPVILGTQRTSNSDWIQAVLGAIGQASYVKSIKAITPYVPPAGASHSVYHRWLMTTAGKVQNPAQYDQHPYAIADYDAINITALAMTEAHSTAPAAYNKFIIKVTAAAPGAVQVHSYSEGLK